MTEASDFLPNAFSPTEELVVEKAQCRECETKVFENARAWAHNHVRETGHVGLLTFTYDVRDENWMERLAYERQAEIMQVSQGGWRKVIEEIAEAAPPRRRSPRAKP
ncbi:hypothetical protein LRS10_23415 [Phenylobacterium sp. J426]|uniref:hypothetical protein n=1 Tax=Phenylobacterium sp. J426 TaxID=2898439 RepID=UPI0021516285|nr:hypothetical protein [Phenylobacterium sp. J426]MCR5876841.1 hypothetical protein [Phenylobacterium sp. J426]